MKKLVCLAVIFLTACGGGGGSSDTPVTPTPPSPPPAPQPQWASPIDLPQTTTSITGAFTSLVIPVDYNNDGYTDIVAHYYWNDWDSTRTDTSDLLVFYTNDYGNWRIEKEISLRKTTRKYAKGDLNNDGIEDIAFAVNYEDGKKYNSCNDLAAKPVVLLSNSTSYDIVELGEPDWGHAVDIIDNKVTFAGFCGLTQSFVNSQPVEHPDVSGLTFKYVGDNIIDYSEGVRLITQTGETLDYLELDYTLVNIITWNGQESPVKMIEWKGKTLIGAGFDTFEVFETTAVGKLAGRLIENYDPNVTYSETELPLYQELVFIDTTYNTIDVKEYNIVEEDYFNFYQVADINNDYNLDIVTHLHFDTPGIYLSNSLGDLTRYTGELPQDSTEISKGMYYDLTRDDVGDIIQVSVDFDKPYIRYFKGKESL